MLLNKNWRVLLISYVLMCTFVGIYAQSAVLEKDTLFAGELMIQANDLLDEGSLEASIELINQAMVIYSKFEHWKKVTSCEVKLTEIADNFDSPELKNQTF